MIPPAGAPVRPLKRSGLRSAISTLSLLFIAGPLAAQSRVPPVFSLMGGASSYRLAGTGTTYVIGLRFDEALGRYVIVEPGATFFSYQPTVAGRINYLMPEVSLQGQAHLGPIKPFVGTGIGFATITNGPNLSKTTLHVVGGTRVRLPRGWGLRFEFRARSVDPWNGRTHDFMAGISHIMIGGM